MKSILTVVGARPQFIKAAAVSRAMKAHGGLEELIVHTGQHYDASLSDIFFSELDIPRPAYNLGVGSGAHGAQTGEMLQAIEQVILQRRPDLLLVYGDTNSTLAGALAAVKLHVPVAHVEAGLRSFNRNMPEEINRIVTDHVAEHLFCPTRTAVQHLRNEGITRGVHHVGDVMYDVALELAVRAEASSRFRDGRLEHKRFVLATVHRAENTDDPARLGSIIGALGRLGNRHPVVLPLHPRTRDALKQSGLAAGAGVEVIEPVGPIDMAWLERHAALVLTDSGGVQKEAYFHRTPCVTIRTETEWVETVDAGWNRLADPTSTDGIVSAALAALEARLPTGEIADYGTGRAAFAVVGALTRALS